MRREYKNDKGEPISRQRYHQLKRTKDGKCIICSEPLDTERKDRCSLCVGKHKETSVKRYRLKNGIPLDLPVREYKKQGKE